MFNKEKFSDILTKIYRTYNNQRDFAEATGVNRGYLSQYINKKLENPPTPKILEKLSNASKRNNQLPRTYGNMWIFFSYFKCSI